MNYTTQEEIAISICGSLFDQGYYRQAAEIAEDYIEAGVFNSRLEAIVNHWSFIQETQALAANYN